MIKLYNTYQKPLTRQEEIQRYGIDLQALAEKAEMKKKEDEWNKEDAEKLEKENMKRKLTGEKMYQSHINDLKYKFGDEIKKTCVRMEEEAKNIYKIFGYEQFKDSVDVARKVALDSVNERYNEDFLRRNMYDNL